MKKTAWLPLSLVVLALFACNRSKPATTVVKPPVKTTPEPAAEKNYALSAPMDQGSVIAAYGKAATELDAAALAGTEVDLGDFLLKLGLEARGACAAGGRLVILRPADLAVDDSDPTARGLVAGFVDTETGECARNLGFCSLSITREKSGRFQLRAADLVLKVGHAALTISGEYPLGKTAWAMVVTDEETAACKALANPEKSSDEESESSGDLEGSQPNAQQEVLLFANGEFFSVSVEPLYQFENAHRYAVETKVDLAIHVVGSDVLPAPETWILAQHRYEERTVTGYNEDESESESSPYLQDSKKHFWTCEKLTAAGRREALSPAEAEKLLKSPQYSYLKCGQEKSLDEEDNT